MEVAQTRSSPKLVQIQKDPVKLTALLYLREALIEEAYEECSEYIQTAREFGATDWEIKELLEDIRRMPT